ncbi:MAG: polysaccharide biosynthesis tyrosine autokinase [Acidobacteria bacterium]|nr:polysaccharide biosynthesis tyrosine autokinase [Acidobacteriota bacterium]MCA1640419.1 polysaccharide biosynthesis tyrosine autokinase [Acidobacteriota bacterium]
MSQDNRLLPSLPVERGLDRPLSDLAQPKSYGSSSLAEPAHLREYLNVVLKRKWLILSLVLVVTSLVTIHMYRTPSIFEAATTIQIEQKQNNILSTGKGGVVINTGRANDPAYINTQLRLLENPALARQVIRTLDLQNNPAFFGGQQQSGFIASVKRIFAGEKKAPPVEPAPGTLPVVHADEVTDNKLSQEELDKLEPYELTLAAGLRVEPIVGTNLVTLKFQHTNPELARQVVNTLADTFIYNSGDREEARTQADLKKLGERIAELQQVIRAGDEQRVEFLTHNKLPVGELGDNLLAQRQKMLSEQLLTAENERKDKESIYRAASSSPDPWSIPEVQESKRVQELRKQLDDLKLKRDEMRQTYTDEWPGVKKLNAQIVPLEEALLRAPAEVVSAMKTRYESAKAREDSLRRAYNLQSGQTDAQNRALIQVGVLKQELETNKQEYDTLRQRQRELENNAVGSRQNNVTVTNYARVPHEPVGPARTRTIVLAFLLSLGVGVGLAFLLDYLDDTLKSVDDVDRYLHLPSLALIPASRGERARLIGGRRTPAPKTEGDPMTALALTSDVRSPSAEAYRHLRTSLLLSSAGQPPKTILITSSQPSEGKTTTAVNTAITLAQTGADVLIMDCDLRRPRVHANFGVPNARGLTNYLSGERDLDTLVQTYDKLPNLKVLTSGPIPPNPAELLGSVEMRRLLTALSERFTHIVIDSPPAISFTDASILSTLVDGVMLVVHGGRSSRGLVRRAKQQLVDVGANIFGIVLNNVRLDSPDYYYSGYYSNYYAHPEDDEEVEEAEEGVAGRVG